MSITPHPVRPLSFYKSLHDVRGRREAGEFLVEGIRAVSQVIQARPESVTELVAPEDGDVLAGFSGYPLRRVSGSQFRSICASTTPSGLLAVAQIPRDSYSPLLPDEAGGRILALEDVQDPGNVGALVRSAAAFDFSGVLLSDKCADPFGPKAVQASAGALLSMWIRKTAAFFEGMRNLADRGHYCVAADVRGPKMLCRVNSARLVLMLGNEANGISEKGLECARSVMKIPINASNVESLNVAASGAICMYALTQGLL